MWDEDHDEAGCPRHQIGDGHGVDAADAINGGKDDEGRREFHQSRVKEVKVEVPTRGPHVHDEALVQHGTREPEEEIIGQKPALRTPVSGTEGRITGCKTG